LGHKVAGAIPVVTMARQDVSQKFQVPPVACGAKVLQLDHRFMHQPHTQNVRLPFSSNLFSSTTTVTLTFLLTEQRARWHAVPA